MAHRWRLLLAPIIAAGSTWSCQGDLSQEKAIVDAGGSGAALGFIAVKNELSIPASLLKSEHPSDVQLNMLLETPLLALVRCHNEKSLADLEDNPMTNEDHLALDAERNLIHMQGGKASKVSACKLVGDRMLLPSAVEIFLRYVLAIKTPEFRQQFKGVDGSLDYFAGQTLYLAMTGQEGLGSSRLYQNYLAMMYHYSVSDDAYEAWWKDFNLNLPRSDLMFIPCHDWNDALPIFKEMGHSQEQLATLKKHYEAVREERNSNYKCLEGSSRHYQAIQRKFDDVESDLAKYLNHLHQAHLAGYYQAFWQFPTVGIIDFVTSTKPLGEYVPPFTSEGTQLTAEGSMEFGLARALAESDPKKIAAFYGHYRSSGLVPLVEDFPDEGAPAYQDLPEEGAGMGLTSWARPNQCDFALRHGVQFVGSFGSSLAGLAASGNLLSASSGPVSSIGSGMASALASNIAANALLSRGSFRHRNPQRGCRPRRARVLPESQDGAQRRPQTRQPSGGQSTTRGDFPGGSFPGASSPTGPQVGPGGTSFPPATGGRRPSTGADSPIEVTTEGEEGGRSPASVSSFPTRPGGPTTRPSGGSSDSELDDMLSEEGGSRPGPTGTPSPRNPPVGGPPSTPAETFPGPSTPPPGSTPGTGGSITPETPSGGGGSIVEHEEEVVGAIGSKPRTLELLSLPTAPEHRI